MLKLLTGITASIAILTPQIALAQHRLELVTTNQNRTNIYIAPELIQRWPELNEVTVPAVFQESTGTEYSLGVIAGCSTENPSITLMDEEKNETTIPMDSGSVAWDVWDRLCQQ